MIDFNGHSYSGSVIKNDKAELIVTVISNDTLPDMCLALNDVKSVTETTEGGSNVIYVNTATSITAAANGIYNITFSKKLSVIDEMSEAIDRLLLMALEV